MNYTPTVVMFAVCESIQRDVIRGVYTLNGVVGAVPWVIERERFPATYGRLAVYVMLSNIHGEAKFDIRLAPLSGAKGGRQHCMVRAESPLDCCDAAINLGYWGMDGPGEYALELLWDETPLVARRLSVRKPGQRQGA